jgi:hypothetical protein
LLGVVGLDEVPQRTDDSVPRPASRS